MIMGRVKAKVLLGKGTWEGADIMQRACMSVEWKWEIFDASSGEFLFEVILSVKI